jgi:hypothetical protein
MKHGGNQDIKRAVLLFAPYLPAKTELIIEETDCQLIARYLIRLTYTRKKRQIGMLAKTDTLPAVENEHFFGLLRQIVLSEPEVIQAFRTVQMQEASASKQAFIWNDKHLTYGVSY